MGDTTSFLEFSSFFQALNHALYGRYERGEREPSYQSACFIAQTFHCNVDFLYGISDQMETDQIIISRSESPELYELVQMMQTDQELLNRITTYAKQISRNRKS